MIEHAPLLLGLAIAFGLFMTWGVGANDVANAMGTSVGSKAITVRKAILIAAVFEFAGAFLAGGQVTGTIRKGIIDAGLIPDPQTLIYGMLAALLASGIWLLVASAFGWPVSTTHTIVGAIIGFGMVGMGSEAVDWPQVGQIVISWIISPVLGGIIAFGLAISIRKLILDADDPMGAARRWGPAYVFLMGMLISLVTLYKGLAHLDLVLTDAQSLGVSVGIGLLIALLGKVLISRIKEDEYKDKEFHFVGVEKVFAPLCVFTACSMAFAHGSNDVANGIGPLAAIVTTLEAGAISQEAVLPLWILALGGGGIVLGLATLGYKVMRTIGQRITELTPSRGFCAELAAASTVVVASRLGLPVSTTHIIVGAVLGVGFARGVAAIDLRVVAGIVTSWVITLPIAAGTAAVIFKVLSAVLG